MREKHNSTTEAGRHGEGSGLGVNMGARRRGGGRVTAGQAPITGERRSFDGLHPERIKELKNEGERQAEEQIAGEAQPFGGGTSHLEVPPEAGNELGTMPEDEPEAGLEHENEPHEATIPRKRLGAVTGGGPIPRGDAHTGGMHTKPTRGGSPFYGD